MSRMDQLLAEWASEVEREQPYECPDCKRELATIRYAVDCDRTTIHLTGAVNEHQYYVAECPDCKHRLKTAPYDPYKGSGQKGEG